MSLATTAGILLCLTCIRIIVSSLFHEHDIFIRAISGLLAGTAVHLAATPALSVDGKLGRRHRIDDPNIITAFIYLSLYALFDILIAQHVIWGIFPYLGWAISFVLQTESSSSHERDFSYAHTQFRDRYDRRSMGRLKRDDIAVTTRRHHRSKNSRGAVDVIINGKSYSELPISSQSGGHDTETNLLKAKQISDGLVISAAISNANAFYQGSEGVRILPSASTPLIQSHYGHRSRAGSSHVTFVDTAFRPPKTNFEGFARISGEETKEVTEVSDTSRNPKSSDTILALEVTTPVCIPLTRGNIRRLTQSPGHSDDELSKHQTVSSENITFYTAESSLSDSDDSEYTVGWMTVQSEESSSTAKASSNSFNLREEVNLDLGGQPSGENFGDDRTVPSESSSDEGVQVNSAVVLFDASRNQPTEPIGFKPALIPQDYISQTYVRVEKFVSAIDGTELGEQIEVIPGEPQENSNDKEEIRSQRRYLQSLLTYEPSETSSSTSVRLSELEGNMKAIDRRAEEHRRKSLEARRKKSVLGEKRKLALNSRRSNEAFRIKCIMQEYEKEAVREDKKAAKLFFLARNKPGSSMVDVHSLRKEEALKAVEKALREVQLKGGHDLRVIVGQGIHSMGGQAVLKPFLKREFLAQKMRVYESSNNPGVLVINMT